MVEKFLLAFIPVFVAIDPIGLVAIFMGLGTRASSEHRKRQAFLGLFTGLLVSIGFIFLGKIIFKALGITVADFQVAGGLILLALAVRELAGFGPHDRGGFPIGGEFYTIFNVEYTFPIFGELQGAIFTDAGNLLPDADNPGFNDMRYAIGAGLRYKLPIGPIRLDYGVNPDPKPREDFGAFHFSFGFAF